METRIQDLMTQQDKATRRHAAPWPDEELWEKWATMTRNTQHSAQEVRGLRMQSANASTLAARVAPAATQAPKERGDKFSNSPDFSGSDRTRLRRRNSQLGGVIWDEPASFPDEQPKMQCALNHLREVALGQIMPHVQESGEIWLEDLPAVVELLEAAFGDPDQVATAERKMHQIKLLIRVFSQHYAEFRVIAAHMDWNPSALRNALRMGSSEEMNDSFTYSDMVKEPPVFVWVYQKLHNQIQQPRAEMAAQPKGGTGCASSPKQATHPKDPTVAPAGSVAWYTGPALPDLSAGQRRICAEEWATSIADGRCLHCGGFDHWAAECMAR